MSSPGRGRRAGCRSGSWRTVRPSTREGKTAVAIVADKVIQSRFDLQLFESSSWYWNKIGIRLFVLNDWSQFSTLDREKGIAFFHSNISFRQKGLKGRLYKKRYSYSHLRHTGHELRQLFESGHMSEKHEKRIKSPSPPVFSVSGVVTSLWWQLSLRSQVAARPHFQLSCHRVLLWEFQSLSLITNKIDARVNEECVFILMITCDHLPPRHRDSLVETEQRERTWFHFSLQFYPNWVVSVWLHHSTYYIVLAFLLHESVKWIWGAWHAERRFE